MKNQLIAISILISGCNATISTDGSLSASNSGNNSSNSSVVTLASNCVPDNYNEFCTAVQGQIFYTVEQLMAAPVINGQLNFQYRLQDFQVYLLGSNHAYTAHTDRKGRFNFSNVEPGEYVLIAKLVPQTGSEIFTDCKWKYLPSGAPYCQRVENAEPYKIGLIQEGIRIGVQQKATLSLINVDKLYVDASGNLEATQQVTSDNSAPIVRPTIQISDL